MRLPSNIICIDLETTDSDSKTGSIIQLSAIAVNEEFEPIHARTFDMFIQPLDSYRNPKAMAVNKISEETLKTATPLQEALIMFESFCDNDNILASWGAYFDIPFLRNQYEKIYRKYPFSYRCFDLKSIAIWELGKRGIPIRGGVSKFLNALHKEFSGSQHNAIDDIRNAVEILRLCK
ncbi:MAG: 3'-5' exonuclease [Methanogenium sp.]|jgi:DNA polymerase III alpha subunit (gram-positive type)